MKYVFESEFKSLRNRSRHLILLAKAEQLTVAVSRCITGIGWIFKGARVNRVRGTDSGRMLVWTQIGQWAAGIQVTS
jgi:hypothetical protein